MSGSRSQFPPERLPPQPAVNPFHPDRPPHGIARLPVAPVIKDRHDEGRTVTKDADDPRKTGRFEPMPDPLAAGYGRIAGDSNARPAARDLRYSSRAMYSSDPAAKVFARTPNRQFPNRRDSEPIVCHSRRYWG